MINRREYYDDLLQLARDKRATYGVQTASFGLKQVRDIYKAEDMPTIDIMIITHNHYDHLDIDTMGRLWQNHKPRIIAPLGNDTVFIPGHGPTSNFGHERETNMFVSDRAMAA